MRVKNEFLKSTAQIFERVAPLLIVFCCLVSDANGQRKKTAQSSKSAKLSGWSGTWTRASRNARATIEIKLLPRNRFRFDLNALFGANDGVIGGVAKVRGDTAEFDDLTAPAKDFEANGCKLTFVKKGNRLKIKQSAECNSRAGVGVVFGGDYVKGKAARQTPETLVQRGVFPTARLDRKFKTLVDKDYE